MRPRRRSDGRCGPHQVTIERTVVDGQGFRATVVHINAAGAMVKVQLPAPWGVMVRVEIPQERYRALELTRQSDVFVRVHADSFYVAPA